jgi:hypothetical protein
MMAPTAIVAGAFGYLCWPYANDPAAKPEATGVAKAKESLASLLSPPAASDPDRDPFNSQVLPQSANFAAAQGPASTDVKSQEAKATAAPPRAGETVIATTLADLALQGTHIQGSRRLAVINGSVYAEGDEITTSGMMSGPYKVVRVFAHRVEVLCDGQAVELTYSGHEPKAN